VAALADPDGREHRDQDEDDGRKHNQTRAEEGSDVNIEIMEFIKLDLTRISLSVSIDALCSVLLVVWLALMKIKIFVK
jgi:hypothetical protein